MRLKRSLVLVTGLAVLGACGGGGSEEPEVQAPPVTEPEAVVTTTTAPEEETVVTSGPSGLDEPAPETAWEAITAGIGADGDVPLEVALQAFSLTLGPLPDVELPADLPAAVGADSGTTALAWITRHEASLSPEQRIAVANAIAPTGAAPVTTDPGTVADADGAPAPPAVGGMGRSRPALGSSEFTCTTGGTYTSADQAGTQDYRYYVDTELGVLESRFGESLGVPVYVTLGTVPETSETLAFASPQSPHCEKELATSCEIRFMTNKLAGAEDERIRATVAHELVHCFQARWRPPYSSLTQVPWMMEGFPDFVGNMLHPDAPRTNLALYVKKYSTPLFERTYDAQGFFFHLYRIGADPIHTYKSAFVLDDSMAMFETMVGSASTFADSWGPIHAFDQLRGNAWYMPDAPPGSDLYLIPSFLENGDRPIITTKAFPANYLEQVKINADVVKFNVGDGAHGRISWDGGGEAMLSAIDGRLYCARPGGCECPEGSQGSPPDAQVPSNSMLVAVTGTTSVGNVEVIGVSLDDFCKIQPKELVKVDPCVVGKWVSSEWTLPGPIPEMDGLGGDGARVTVHADGRAEFDFRGMSPIAVNDEQIDVTTAMYSDGEATADLEANDGSWNVTGQDLDGMEGWAEDNIIGRYDLEKGPGLMVLLSDGSYTCGGGGDLLSYSTTDPVEGSTISIVMHRD